MESLRKVAVSGLLLLLLAAHSANGFADTYAAESVSNPCDSVDCSAVENSICVDGYCECIDGYVSIGSTKCLPAATQYGDPCEKDAQCKQLTPTQNVILCTPYSNRCLCPVKYHFHDAMCWFSSNLTDSCTSDYHCVVENSVCKEYQCACKEGYVAESDVSCVEESVSNPCESVDCSTVENTTCVDGSCECIDGYVRIDSTKCLPVATQYGDPCEEDAQCKPLTPTQSLITCHPFTNTCVCPTGFNFFDAVCWFSSNLTQGCTNDRQCVVENSVCKNFVCSCGEGYVPESEVSCVEESVGNPCESVDCSAVENSICVDGVCECIDGFVSIGSTKCLPVATHYGDSCEQDAQCKSLTPQQNLIFCSPYTNTCLCPVKYHFHDAMCWFSSNLTEGCISDYHCVVENSVCKDYQCACKEGYVAESDVSCVEESVSNPCESVDCSAVENTICVDGACECIDGYVSIDFTKCLPVATQYGDPCEEHAQCKPLTPTQGLILCSPFTNTCACPTGYHFVDAICWFPSNLTQACIDDRQCVVENSVCKNSVCSCGEGYVPESEVSCVEENVSNPCESVDCSALENSMCVDGVCECIDGFVSIGSTNCLPVATHYGDPCEVDSQCKPLTPTQNLIFCSSYSNTCLCPGGYHFTDAMCWASSNLTEVCISDYHCVVENSVCKHHQCACKEGYVTESDVSCVEVVTQYGDPCEKDAQCKPLTPTQDLILCSPFSDTCTCPLSYHFSNAVCWASMNLTQDCINDHQCVVENSVCQHYVCRCMEGYVMEDIDSCAEE